MIKNNIGDKLNSENRIFINEVVTRDGFQNEKTFIPTDVKIDFINKLSNLGFTKIEVTSFVSAKAIPALADADEVCRAIERNESVKYTALVPNMRGLERALEFNLDELNLVMSASESHNQSNLRRSREESLLDILAMARVANKSNTAINVSISTAFGCPFEGSISDDNLFTVLDKLLSDGISNITLCDTTGMAYPTLVSNRLEAINDRYKDINLTLHFHNTRGMGLVNCLTALQSGIRHFDSSLGELGGCPYAPGATGNVCTEELTYMFDLMSWNTGLDINGLLDTAKLLESIVGRKVPSQLLRAGLIADPAP